MKDVYRIYTDRGKGLEIECQVTTVDDMLAVLDMLIIGEHNQTVLVIQYNIAEDWDFPIFGYHGNIEKYIKFKNSFEDKKGDNYGRL